MGGSGGHERTGAAGSAGPGPWPCSASQAVKLASLDASKRSRDGVQSGGFGAAPAGSAAAILIIVSSDIM